MADKREHREWKARDPFGNRLAIADYTRLGKEND